MAKAIGRCGRIPSDIRGRMELWSAKKLSGQRLRRRHRPRATDRRIPLIRRTAMPVVAARAGGSRSRGPAPRRARRDRRHRVDRAPARRPDRPPAADGAGGSRSSPAGQVLQIGRGLWILRDFERLDARGRFRRSVGLHRTVPRGGRRRPRTVPRRDHVLRERRRPSAPVVAVRPGLFGGVRRRPPRPFRRCPAAASCSTRSPGAAPRRSRRGARGFRALGVELLPPAVLAARVKTHFELPPERLEAAAARTLADARATARRGPPVPSGDAPALRPRGARGPDAPRATRCPLATTPEGRAVRVAFGRILIPVSRLRRSPCLGYGGVNETDTIPDPFAEFRRAIVEMREDLEELAGRRRSWGPRAGDPGDRCPHGAAASGTGRRSPSRARRTSTGWTT